MKNLLTLKLTACVLFVLLFTFGLLLSQLKPLWNDELYSQINSVERISYFQILLGHVPEGNNSPLFYVLQKAICEVTHFQLPLTWQGQWSIGQPQAQVILRFMPNFFMSLALAMIFYVFAVEYSWLAGAYAFLTALASSAVWMYWAEARPYALWFVLTTGQILCFVCFIRNPQARLTMWRFLTGIHLFLSITSVFGVVQVFIVSLLLFVFYEKELTRYVLMLFLPLALGFFYFFNAPHYVFRLPDDLTVLIFDHVPIERLALMALCAMGALGLGCVEKTRGSTALVAHLGMLVVLFFGATAAIMLCLAMTVDLNWKGFVVPSRYFIFLTPMGIIATVVFFFELIKKIKNHPWLMINCGILVGGLLIARSLKIMIEMCAMGIY